MITILTLAFVLFVVCEPTTKSEVQLVEAISKFNADAKSDRIGVSQRRLDEDEVVAAIRHWNNPDAPISPELLATFKQIAETKILPENAAFEVLTGYDPGGQYVFDVWSVRIRLAREDGSSFAFILRETYIASRTLEEELERLKASWNGERELGQCSVWRRIEELQKRIQNPTKSQ
jgi:hypothetical protein